jgi:hypothetical protein
VKADRSDSVSGGRYCPRDFASPRSIEVANYDRLRDAGLSRERAREVAKQSVDKTLRKLEVGVGLDAKAPAGPTGSTSPTRRSPFRVPFDWETPGDVPT